MAVSGIKSKPLKPLRRITIEEAYEVADAIERSNVTDLKEELETFCSSILSQIAKEKQSFEFNDVVETITEKLIRRHPYVFSNKKQHSSAEQLNKWEEIKAQERIEKKQEEFLMV